jgi:transposase-like protein
MTGESQAGVDDAPGERQVPFFCPYCGEEELRPSGAKAGDWLCHACARSFQLRFTGVLS